MGDMLYKKASAWDLIKKAFHETKACFECKEKISEEDKSVKFTSWVPIVDQKCEKCGELIKKFNCLKEYLEQEKVVRTDGK